MPILALLAILAGAYFWLNRVKRGAQAAGELADMAGDALAAARRFSYRRRANQHPADAVDDPRVAGAALLHLAAAQDGLVTQAEEREINRQLQRHYGILLGDAEELSTLGRWLAGQSAPDEMARRLVRRAVALKTPEELAALDQMLDALAEAGDPQGPQDIRERLARAST